MVRVPTAVEERGRQRLQAMGRSLLAMRGIHVSGKWWQGKIRSKIRSEAPEWVIERLELFSRHIAPLEAEAAKLTSRIEAAVSGPEGGGCVFRGWVSDWVCGFALKFDCGTKLVKRFLIEVGHCQPEILNRCQYFLRGCI